MGVIKTINQKVIMVNCVLKEKVYVKAVLALLIALFVNTSNELMASSFCNATLTSFSKLDADFTCTGNLVIDGAHVLVSADVQFNGTVTIENGGALIINNNGTFTANEINFDSSSDSIVINPGGWLFYVEGSFEYGKFINNGYCEHFGDKHDMVLKGTDVTGNGVFYIESKHYVQLKGGSTIHGKNNGGLTNDKFICGSTTLSVKRLPKFKIEEDGLELGDDLLITDTLDLNNKNINLQTYDLTLPKSKSYSRYGAIAEYLKTGSTGRYKMKILKNNNEHTAPIGRNPYLPVRVNCEDCQGTNISTRVTQNVYLNPESLTGEQTANAIGETWSVIPDQDIAGTVTFKLQWNDGAGGTTSSVLSGFNTSSATSYYWVVGDPLQSWRTDGVNEGVSVSGSDPFWIEIELEGMTAGTEYLFAIGSTGSALPVDLVSFNAKSFDKKVMLTWQTAMEINNDRFEIERLALGENWTPIGEIKGAGNSVDVLRYSFVDLNPVNGINYYRLKQVDFNGEFEYSNVLNVEFTPAIHDFSVYPNP
ncbi:MAG: hypothetical protein ACPGLV_14875, partial [Bacteroidia bacterium]